MLIFMAIMMHKAPASIGFGTFLQHHGLKSYEFAKHLLSFTASSPLMNVLLYFGLCASQKKSDDLDQLNYWVGLLMLISAGSFLYVAIVHILPEVWSTGEIHGHTNSI